MDAGSGQHMGSDQRDQRRQCRGAGTNPVGERGDIQVNAFAGIGFALPVERQVVGEFAGQHHGEKLRPCPATGDWVERRRWLTDRLAGAAAPLLPNRLDDLSITLARPPGSR